MTGVPFESIRVRGPLRVEQLEGEARRLTARKSDRILLALGDLLGEGSRFWLGAGTRITLHGEQDGRLQLMGPDGGRIFFLSFLDENEVGHRLMK